VRTLASLYKSDQDERMATPHAPWPEIEKHDVERGKTVLALLQEGEIRSATDFCRASLMLHHGQDVDSSKLAYSFAWIGYSLDATNKECALLTAQAWDRIMIRQGKLQWYGTQYARRDANSKLASPLPIEPNSVSDEERARFGVVPKN